MKWKGLGFKLMYIAVVLCLWLISFLLRQRERAEYLRYLLSSSLR
jgi:hypothetical protein